MIPIDEVSRLRICCGGNGKSGRQLMQEKVHKVKTPLFPTYSDVQTLMPIFDGVPKAAVTSMLNAISQQMGTPQNPVDWSEPDKWIGERLSGTDQDLARKIWEQSGKGLNPRHVYGSYLFINGYDLLVPDASGTYQTTEKGLRFLDRDPMIISEIDDTEGVLQLLSILETKCEAKRGDILPEWGEFLHEYSNFGTDSTIKDTLRRRLSNLMERGLIDRDGSFYVIDQKGLDYLQETKGPDPLRDITRAIRTYNEEQKKLLRNKLAEMDPFMFEVLISDLLDAMGYEDVEVTKRSGDFGIDVIANAQFGLTRVKEVVQVKRRQGTINRGEMDKLRGSLPYYDAIRGTFITLGTFAKGCIDSALLQRAAPITLIDGDILIDFLVEHEIGIKKKSTDVFELDKEAFAGTPVSEELENTVEP
jgi:restriction system protein